MKKMIKCPPDQKTFAEFFAGIGLMRMGLEAAGWISAFANDIDPDKEEMYQAHFQDADQRFKLRDVHKLDVAAVPSVTLATASFPCNDLSLAGPRTGLSGKQSSAYWDFLGSWRRWNAGVPESCSWRMSQDF